MNEMRWRMSFWIFARCMERAIRVSNGWRGSFSSALSAARWGRRLRKNKSSGKSMSALHTLQGARCLCGASESNAKSDRNQLRGSAANVEALVEQAWRVEEGIARLCEDPHRAVAVGAA